MAAGQTRRPHRPSPRLAPRQTLSVPRLPEPHNSALFVLLRAARWLLFFPLLPRSSLSLTGCGLRTPAPPASSHPEHGTVNQACFDASTERFKMLLCFTAPPGQPSQPVCLACRAPTIPPPPSASRLTGWPLPCYTAPFGDRRSVKPRVVESYLPDHHPGLHHHRHHHHRPSLRLGPSLYTRILF